MLRLVSLFHSGNLLLGLCYEPKSHLEFKKKKKEELWGPDESSRSLREQGGGGEGL